MVRKVPFTMMVRAGIPDCPPSVLSADLRVLGHGDQLMLLDVRTGEAVQELMLDSWTRLIDYRPNRGIALVTVQDRALIIRVRLPAK
ncbi:MAG: hypothetical protein ACI89X_004597 [Planctomycetota bacterium]|jgi:hypothetical protein